MTVLRAADEDAPRPAEGRVAALWRYPVKSMRGEPCAAIGVTARGLDGDRLFAVRDPDGKLGSGKSTRRFRHMEGLLDFEAALDPCGLRIDFPDGRCLRANDPRVDRALSNALARPVILAREDSISHFDAAPVHLVTTAALAWLQERLGGAEVDVRRFRPNIVVAVPGCAQVERSWIGGILAIGEQVRLRVAEPTERCAMVTHAQAGLAQDRRILERVTGDADGQFGVYAEVVVAGEAGIGDRVRLVD